MIPSDKENIDWVRSFMVGDKWFKKLSVRKSGSEATLRYYARALKEFCGYMKMDPDEIIEDFKQGVASNLEATLERWSDNLEFFADYLTKRGLRKSSSAIFHAAIKSFFKYNSRVELKAPTPEYYSERIPPISLDDVKELDKACDVQQRFFLRFLKDSGMSRGDAVNVDYGHIRKEFEKGFKFIHIDAFRSKEKVEYDSWLGPNTVDSLKTCLKVREQRGEKITDNSPLFVTWNKPWHRLAPEGLSAVFRRLTEKSGIIVRPHRIRKFFETYMALAKVHPVILKYWMGHKVATGKKDIEMRYIIPPVEEQRKLYREAYKQIDLSPKPEPEDLLKAEVKARLEAMDPEARKRFAREIATTYRQKAHVILEDEAIKKLLKEKPTRTNDNGSDCQKIVSEDELESYLAKGWRVQAVLPSGKVVISNEK